VARIASVHQDPEAHRCLEDSSPDPRPLTLTPIETNQIPLFRQRYSLIERHFQELLGIFPWDLQFHRPLHKVQKEKKMKETRIFLLVDEILTEKIDEIFYDIDHIGVESVLIIIALRRSEWE
jgi:hypothetical protein